MAQRAYNSRQYQRFRQLRREVGRMAEDRMEEQAIIQQESGPELLIVTSFYPDVSPRQLFTVLDAARAFAAVVAT